MKTLNYWQWKHKHRVSVYAFNPIGKLVFKLKAINPNHRQVVRVAFVINNDHCNLLSPRLTTSIEKGHVDIVGDMFNGIKGLDETDFLDFQYVQFKDLTFKETGNKIVFTECTLPQLIVKYREITGETPFQINKKNEAILVGETIYSAQKDFLHRQKIAGFLGEKTGTNNFKGNKQWASMAINLFSITSGVQLPTSHYNNDVIRLIDSGIGAMIKTAKTKTREMKGNFYGCDMARSYALGVKQQFKGRKIPVLDVFDNYRLVQTKDDWFRMVKLYVDCIT